jgi:membrane protease YdiL (CAAX protease family)
VEYLRIAAIPLFLVLVGLGIVRFRRLSWGTDVGFNWPSPRAAALWIFVFLLWSTCEELLAGGPTARGTWLGKYDATQVAVRIVAVGLIYPIVEEFFFRGVFLGVLKGKFGTFIAVVVPAIIFGMIHTQYDWPIWIIADGLIFGLCRVTTGSVYLPMLLHALGNSYAVWERLH